MLAKEISTASGAAWPMTMNKDADLIIAPDEPVTAKSGKHRARVFGKAMPISRNIELEIIRNGVAWVLARYAADD